MNLLVFGYGYTAAAFVRRVRPRFDAVVATVRSAGKAQAVAADGIGTRVVSPEAADPRVESDIASAQVVLVSVPPGETGDPVLARFGHSLAQAKDLRWVGYLSTIGVYGDHDGGWVDETTPTRPVSRRSRERVAAEEGWLALGQRSGVPVAIFRLAGIYGPGRNPLARIADGSATRIVKPGQVFNRIHVDDIARVLEASLDRPRPGAIYNVTDDEPAPPQDVVAFAAALAGVAPPPETPFEAAEMSPMARSFYGENKRARNGLLRNELGVRLAFPTYREGLTALLEAGED
jgi:nucleoside-diphosphate-sugar epimerase